MILPLGTKIVAQTPITGPRHVYPAGTLAVIVAAPTDAAHSYRVRLSDGFEASLTRSQFVLLRTLQEDGLARASTALSDHDLARSVIYRCVIGSRAYGLDTEDSDTDIRGVYVAPPDRQWSLYGAPEQLESKGTEEVYWEVRKCLVLALKANPNVLEVLHSPDVLLLTPLGQELCALRSRFVSKLVFQTYNGYVLSQFGKMARRRAEALPPKWKHAMHLIRLLLAGIATLREGVVPVRVPEEHRARLLDVRAGLLSFEEIDRWRLELHREFEAAYRVTALPERPDYDAANAFLLRARRAALAES